MFTERNHVVSSGSIDGRPMIFVHGFGCNQSMWNQIVPAFTPDHRVVTYDLMGMGQSDISTYDVQRYSDLEAHADDLIAICDELALENAIVVGHSIGASIGLLAANRAPAHISKLIMVSPTPSFLNDPDNGYHGGFARSDIDELIAFLDENHLGWSKHMAPTITGQPAGAPATEEMTQSFCQTDPVIAQHFGHVTFFADRRADFGHARCPSLILHCDDDMLVPLQVADWMREHVPGTTLQILHASGHAPHMTAPNDVISAMRPYLAQC